jgi:DNA polymerase V
MFHFTRPAINPEPFTAPLFTERCQAGFPSPAQDYVEAELDLNEFCIQRRSSTYFVHAIGNSMTDIGLHSGIYSLSIRLNGHVTATLSLPRSMENLL